MFSAQLKLRVRHNQSVTENPPLFVWIKKPPDLPATPSSRWSF